MKRFWLALLFLVVSPVMAGTLNVSQFHGIALVDSLRPSSVVAGHTGTSTDITTGGTQVQTEAFLADTTIIRVVSNTSVRIAIGDDPTATATSTWLPSGIVEYFAVLPGHRLSVIED